jgi:TolB-like protein
MNPQRFITVTLCVLLGSQAFAQTQGIDKELTDLTERLASQIKDHGKKKVAVLDFTDLQGNQSDLGRYVAEQLTVNLVVGKRDFVVLDRANLKSILAEYKLTATGLVDPENAKKLGQFAGVDALILGTIVPMSGNIDLTAKVITTDTAEIVAAAKARFKNDESVQQLLSHPPVETKVADGAGAPKKEEVKEPKEVKITKSFGDLRVELEPLKIVNGGHYVLNMTLTNQNAKRIISVALNTDMGSTLKGVVTDADGNEYPGDGRSVSGVVCTAFQRNGFWDPTELKPGESISTEVKFFPRSDRTPTAGTCRLQLEFLLGREVRDHFGPATVNNFTTKIEAN